MRSRCSPAPGRRAADMAAFAEGRPLAAPRGRGSSTLRLHAGRLQDCARAADDAAYRELPRRALSSAGLKGALFETDAPDLRRLSYFVATARDFARIGLRSCAAAPGRAGASAGGLRGLMRTPTAASERRDTAWAGVAAPNPRPDGAMPRVAAGTPSMPRERTAVRRRRSVEGPRDSVRLGDTPLDGRFQLGKLVGDIVEAVP
jgi:hypothetical protein